MSEIGKLGAADVPAGSEEDVSQDVVTHVGSLGRPGMLDSLARSDKRRSGPDPLSDSELKRAKSRRARQTSTLGDSVINGRTHNHCCRSFAVANQSLSIASRLGISLSGAQESWSAVQEHASTPL